MGRMFIVFVGLLLTLSRSAVLGLIVGLAVIVLARGLSKRVLRLGMIAGGLLLLASPFLIRYALAYSKFSIGAGTSAGARLESWAMALQVIADYPAFGVGFNAYKYAAQSYGSSQIGASSYNSDGGLLFVLALTGVVGLAVYCAMLGRVVVRCRSIWRDAVVAPGSRGLAIGTAAATIGVVAQSTFVNAIMTTFIMEILWVLWGLTFVIAHARDSRPVAAVVNRPLLVRLAA
jgi:O-antigen ligase